MKYRQTEESFWSRYGVYLLVFIAMIPALIFRDFTPDNELRYVSIAAESIDDGTFVAFTNHGEPYADKPPLYMWICMLGYWLFGNNCLWFVSLFSVIPAFVITEVMSRWSAPVMPRRWQVTSRLMLLSSVLYLGLALTMRMDMLMAMFIVLSLRVFYRIYSGDERVSLRWLFPVYIFLALFTKGPYGILIPLVSTILFLALERKIKSIGRYWGWRTWTILIGLSVIWFGAVFLEGGTPYLDNLLVKQTVGRAVKSFTHDEPFYYYFITIWYSIAPWSFAVIGVIIASLCSRRIRKELSETERFFLTTAVATMVMLSMVSSKLAVYLLPAFPFIIYGGALLFRHYEKSGWLRISLLVPLVIFAILPFALPVVEKKNDEFITMWVVLAVSLLSVGSIMGIICMFSKTRYRISKAFGILGVSIFLFLFCGGMAIPDFNPQIGYKDMAGKALKFCPSASTPIYTYNVRRPENLDVYLGREIQELQRKEGEEFHFPTSGILLIRQKDLGTTTTPVAVSGKYAIVVLTPNFKIDE